MRMDYVLGVSRVLTSLRAGLSLLVIVASGDCRAAAEEPAVAAPPSEMRAVVVEGVGRDVDEARRDAYRVAVRQVLGTLVDSKTLVENDQLITDRVVVFSNGFVENIELLPGGETRDDGGLVRMRFKAVVKSGKLDETLRGNGISPSESTVVVDNPRAQLARIVSEQERKRNAREMFLAMADGYPANCFTAAVGQPKIVEVSDGVAQCEVRVKIAVRQKEYDEFARRLITFLESGPVEAQGDFQLHSRGRIADLSSNILGTSPAGKWRSGGAEMGPTYIHDFSDPGALTPDKKSDVVRRTGKENIVWISVYSGSPHAFSCRWFGIDHAVVSYPMAGVTPQDDRQPFDLPQAMLCSVALREPGGTREETIVTIKRVGYSSDKEYSSPWGLYFMPGYRLCFGEGGLHAPVKGNPFGPTFEFVVPLAVPEALFDKPGLTVEATLANVPVNAPKP